jgi:signal recognition particle subunit SEC65
MINLNPIYLDSDLESEFRRIAEELMIKTSLQTNKNIYRFAEVEFYLYHKELHPDSSTHCNPRQLTYGSSS